MLPRPLAPLVAIGLSLGACRSVPPAESPATPREVSPTLEEIFLDPPLHGRAPRALSLSGDGQWLLVDWSPPEGDLEGAWEEGERERTRLLSIERPASGQWLGTPLSELLPPPADHPEGASSSPIPRLATWSQRGRRLALVRGHELWLLDPLSGEAARLLRGELAPPSEPGEAEQNGEPEDPLLAGRPRLGRPTSLAFEPGDRELFVSDGSEAYLVPLPEPDAPVVELELDGVRWLTEAVEAPADELGWSDDRRAVLVAPRAADEEGQPESRAQPEPAQARVLHLDSGRTVVLEGLAELEELGRPQLSPDGRWVFAERVDRSAEPEPTIVPDYLTERVSTRRARRKLADDGPSPCAVWVWSAESGQRTRLELPGEERWWTDARGWAPQPEADSPARLLISRRADDHRTRQLWVWREGELELAIGERDERWFGGPATRAHWSADGRRLIFGSECLPNSTTPGRCQVFALDLERARVHQLTEVAGEVAALRPLEGGGVVFTASDQEPARRWIGLVSPERERSGAGAGGVMRLPAPEGWCGLPLVSPDRTRAVFESATLGHPAELWQSDLFHYSQLTRSAPAAFEAIPWIRPALFRLQASDGARVSAHVFLPPETSLAAPDAPRAAIVFAHGAGYLQNVRDSLTAYPLNFMFHSRLASLGYAVIDVDYRGSAGYGNRFRTDVQYHLGGRDLQDIHEVVRDLAALGVIDGERVGIYGGSYGGFLTLMALFTAPERWRVGAALRSVSDWRSYYPNYTQPRLGRPSTHAEAYRRSCPIDLVSGLEDPLLILHGMVDTNVFAQDSIRLIEALIDASKDFDAMLYPSQGHRFEDGRHWLDEYRRIEAHLLEHLGPPVLPDPPQ